MTTPQTAEVTTGSMRKVSSAAAFVAILTVTLAACTPAGAGLDPAPPQSGDQAAGPVQPVGEPVTLAGNLDVPWSIVTLESGSILISERDTAQVKEVTTTGEVRLVGTVDSVVAGGEGGLLGLALLDSESAPWLYAYITTASDNRIVRMPLGGAQNSYSLGAPEVILSGIAKAGNHNGGRIAFGPDTMLYATTGDAGVTARSQDRSSLNGKILRMTPAGAVPSDNPVADSFVYSLGHRNPQGIAWDTDGTMWAAEFGQNTWDELNVITPGSNYGWPEVEGRGNVAGFVDPVHQWTTAESSPSGLAIVRGTLFLAALRGERLWVIYPNGVDSVEAVSYLENTFGRLRDVAAGPNGSLLVLTNNTGRGAGRAGDDRLVKVQLSVLR